MKAEIKDGNLIITIPVETELRPSASGKTLVVASTHGGMVSSVQVNGKPVTINLNAYIKR